MMISSLLLVILLAVPLMVSHGKKWDWSLGRTYITIAAIADCRKAVGIFVYIRHFLCLIISFIYHSSIKMIDEMRALFHTAA